MVQLQSDIEDIEAAGIKLVAISYDSVEMLKQFAKQKKITYTMLSDPDSKTIDAFGVRNEEVRKGSRQDGVPHPGTFLIGKDGKIKAKIPGTVRRRHDSKKLIEVVNGLSG